MKRLSCKQQEEHSLHTATEPRLENNWTQEQRQSLLTKKDNSSVMVLQSFSPQLRINILPTKPTLKMATR